ncbi:MAG: hypothetical protein GX493_09105 [Firmicutes bacterium]|nr:hypothetical protein [Bacillota bacterium]
MEKLLRENPLLLAPLLVLQLALQVAAVVDILRRGPETLRGGRRWPWLALAVLGSLLGAVIYFAVGRKEE